MVRDNSVAIIFEDDIPTRKLKKPMDSVGDSMEFGFRPKQSADLNFMYSGNSLDDLELSMRDPDPVVVEVEKIRVKPRRGGKRNKYQEEKSHEDSLSPDGTVQKINYVNEEAFVKALEKRHEVDMTAENMDPIEWVVRSTVPIPEKYYWDTVHESDMEKVPTHIKVWHNTVAGLWSAYSFTENWISKPLVDSTGLTNHRHDYVTDFMTKEEWEQSKRTVQERIRKRKEWEKRQQQKFGDV